MERYKSQQTLVNEMFDRYISKMVMDFFVDPRINWTRNSMNSVIEDIEYADITFPDIREQLNYHNRKELPEEFLAELLSLVKHSEKCKKCRCIKQMWSFHEDNKHYNTCNKCRYNARRNRLINMLNHEVHLYRQYKINRDFYVAYRQVDMAKQHLKSLPCIIFFIDKRVDWKKKKARIMLINNTDLFINSFSNIPPKFF